MAESEQTISGYLYKKTRDGRWQRRWFETNGVYLTYYKSKKMEKLLAALSLPQVGEIKILPPTDDPEEKEGLFSIELNTRIYTLRAKTDDEAHNWVSVLSHLRDQGMGPSSSLSSLNRPSSSMQSFSLQQDSSGKALSAQENQPQGTWIKNSNSCCGIC